MAKLSKKIPKRATNTKAAAKRTRSFNRNQVEKGIRISGLEAAHRDNMERGFTGKQLDNAARKAFGDKYRAYKKLQQNGTLEFRTIIDGPLHKPYVVVTGVRSLAGA